MSTGQQTDPLIGRLVDGRYQVRARIARGGMATVYVATDLRLERRIALKVMHGHLADDSLFESRFVQEARSAARLADPHVVNVFDQGRDGDMAYLVMEYLPGLTLRELLREQRRLGIPEAITILDAVLAGLAAAHRAGIVHRDVKPENVLLAEDGRIKIGDFGLARATTANTASGQLLLGTIAYLAPELVTRGSADARSDLYSLGIMIYEMLTGEQPYRGEQPMQIAFQHATDSVPRPSVKNPGVPEQLDELVLWATERSPDDRPSDAGEMLHRLREIEHELGIKPQVSRPNATRSATAMPIGAPTESVPDDGTTDTGLGSDQLTRVMPGGFTAPTVTPEHDNATRLRRRTRRNAAKGSWLLVLVLLLAAAAAGTGWWFGSGPGSLVAVADVAGGSFADAEARLSKDTLVASQRDVFDLDIPAGTVVGTDPASGQRVEKDSPVTVLVSRGPQPHDIAALAGLGAAQARDALTAAVVTVGDDQRFFTDQPADTVIGATITPRSGDAFDCLNGCQVLEGDSASLAVSLGAVPDVSDSSITEATETLTAAGLRVAGESAQEFSDTYAEGRVIGIRERDGGGNWQPNDEVTLIVSQGPPLFAVPDVTGLTLAEARDKLQNEGFEISYDSRWDSFPDAFTEVKSQDPGSNTQYPRGTSIRVIVGAAL